MPYTSFCILCKLLNPLFKCYKHLFLEALGWLLYPYPTVNFQIGMLLFAKRNTWTSVFPEFNRVRILSLVSKNSNKTLVSSVNPLKMCAEFCMYKHIMGRMHSILRLPRDESLQRIKNPCSR